MLLRSANNYEFNEMVEKLYHIISKECFVKQTVIFITIHVQTMFIGNNSVLFVRV